MAQKKKSEIDESKISSSESEAKDVIYLGPSPDSGVSTEYKSDNSDKEEETPYGTTTQDYSETTDLEPSDKDSEKVREQLQSSGFGVGLSENDDAEKVSSEADNSELDSSEAEESTLEKPKTSHRISDLCKTGIEFIVSAAVLFLSVILLLVSASFIQPTDAGKTAYGIYYGLYIAFSVFVILLCSFVKLNTFSMENFFRLLRSKNGMYSSLASKRRKINTICKAYKNSFIVSGDEDYHKTRANSDLYFGVETWLQDMNRFPLLTFLKIIPGTFIGFGILGTFIGFSEGLSEIKVVDGDMQSITTGVQLLLDGLKNAFNTSIIGVLASVYLNFIVIHPFLNKLSKVSRQLCDYLDAKFYVTEVDAMAILDEDHNFKPFPVVMNEMMAKLETVASNINHLGNTVGMQVTESIKSTMDETIEGIIRGEIEKMKTEFNTIIETLSDCSAQLQAAPQNLKEAAGIIKEASSVSVDEFQKQSQEAINSLIQTINSNLNTKFESYLGTIEKISDSMIKVNEIVEKLPQNLLAVSTSIGSTSQKIIDNTDSFNKAFDDSTKALAQTTDIASKIVQSYDSQISIINNSAVQIENVIAESKRAAQNNQELLKDYKMIDEHIARIFAEVNKNTERYSTVLSNSLAGYFKQFQEATKDVSKQFAEAVMQLSDEIEKLNSGR